MSGSVRMKNGRFSKQKTIDKRKKALLAMAEAKKSKGKRTQTDEKKTDVGEGFRFVNLKELGKNLTCSNCQVTLSLNNVLEETIEGLHSILKIGCDTCGITNIVNTGEKMKINGHTYSAVNISAVLGAVYSGMGCTGLNKILSCLDAPEMSMDMFKKYEREVGPAIEKAAKESCQRAAEEEKCLVIKNVEKLCETLPKEIAEDLYAQLRILESSEVSSLQDFDVACGGVINIVVSYDMGWSKRGNGRSYDSLNGYAAIIGFLGQKVLDYTTRNRQCNKCDRNHDKTDHDCRKNYSGSAKGMEADAGVQLINNSAILQNAKLNVGVLIGDEDSSTIAAIKKGRETTIYKLADKNHLVKNFTNDLYDLANKKNHKELKKSGVIPHLKKCFTYAIAQNKGSTTDLAKAIRSIPDHFYNIHENCGTWCKSFDEQHLQTVVLKDESAYSDIQSTFIKYANSAPKFCVAASSQANESLNSIIASRAPKAKCFCKTESADYRVASAVLTKNEGDSGLLTVKENLGIQPSKYMINSCKKTEKLRKIKSEQKTTKKAKLRRLQLTLVRKNLRQNNERHEGITYQSNIGINSRANIQHPIDVSTDVENSFTISDECALVYFDLETSGLHGNCDILQIAAISNNQEFSVYALPTQPIPNEVSKINGIQYISGEMFYRKTKVDAMNLEDALLSFAQFLNSISPSCMLVAHNASFDVTRLIDAIQRNNLIEKFSVIKSSADTLVLFKKELRDRKGLLGAYKLENLARDVLGENLRERFHEALYDVQILQGLVKKLEMENKLYSIKKSFRDSMKNVLNRQKINSTISQLRPLLQDKVVGKGIIEKMCLANITFHHLLQTFREEGKNGIVTLLSKKCDITNKPLVTKDRKVLDNISTFLSKRCGI